MKSIYLGSDDILQMRVPDKPIAHEVSQDWHTHIRYAEDASIVKIVLPLQPFSTAIFNRPSA